MSSFRTTHPSSAFLKLMEELANVDMAATPQTAVGQMRKTTVRRKMSVRGDVSFTDESEGGGGVTGEDEEGAEEGEELNAEHFQDKRKSKQEARRLKKEMRKKEASALTRHII